MKGKLYLAAMTMLVLILSSLVGVLSYADDQIHASRVYSSTEYWRFGSEHTPYLLPAALPYTEFALAEANLDSGATGAAIATCPSGSIVVGGGYSAHSDVAFYTQYKYENGWRGDAVNNSASSKKINVYAVCLHNVYGLSATQVHDQVDVPSGEVGGGMAVCPAGTIATGGGFHAYPDGSLRVYTSSKYSTGERWQSWAQNLSGSSKTLHAYGICLQGSGGTTVRIQEVVTAPPQGSVDAYPMCSRGWLATGGGFSAYDDHLVVFTNAGPYGDDGWRVGVTNTHPSEDRTFSGFAICLWLRGLPDHFAFLPLVARNSVP